MLFSCVCTWACVAAGSSLATVMVRTTSLGPASRRRRPPPGTALRLIHSGGTPSSVDREARMAASLGATSDTAAPARVRETCTWADGGWAPPEEPPPVEVGLALPVSHPAGTDMGGTHHVGVGMPAQRLWEAPLLDDAPPHGTAPHCTAPHAACASKPHAGRSWWGGTAPGGSSTPGAPPAKEQSTHYY